MEGPARVWLDDLRPAPHGYVRTRTTDETLALLESGSVVALDLDYNLGPEEPKGSRVLQWILERLARQPHWPVPDLAIHASRSAGRDGMFRMVAEIQEKTRVRAASTPTAADLVDPNAGRIDCPSATGEIPPVQVGGHTRPKPTKRKGGDAYGAREADGTIALALADGVGSRHCDWKASRIAVDTSLDVLTSCTDLESRARIQTAFERANEAVRVFEDECAGALTTLVLAVYSVEEHRVLVASVGDSRAYVLRASGLDLLTRDDSIGRTEIHADGSVRKRNPITRAVGQTASPNVEVISTELAPGDALVLASDGAYGFGFEAGMEDLDRWCGLKEGLRPCLFDTREEEFDDDATVVILRRQDTDASTRAAYVEALLASDGKESAKLHPHLMLTAAMDEIDEAARAGDRQRALDALDRMKKLRLRFNGRPSRVEHTATVIEKVAASTFGRVYERLREL